jgi:hypothetical protein
MYDWRGFTLITAILADIKVNPLSHTATLADIKVNPTQSYSNLSW